MSHYRSNVRDLEFNLFEVLRLESVLGQGEFGDLDVATVKQMLDELRRLAEGTLGESYADADRNPPDFDPVAHRVILPESFKRGYRALREFGWDMIGVPQELGGVAVPEVVRWAMSEMVLGAQPAAFFYSLGPQVACLFHGHSDEQRARARIAVANRWAGTMMLTEPDTGSDVGAMRVKAIEQPDGSWHLEGVKRFITSADSDDLVDNIIHLVLARPEGAAPGTKGLSLFWVPKVHYDPRTGELGERNGVFVTGVEHKMGLKASATCEVTFGGNGVPAVGWLVGDRDNGIAQMFRVIAYARMMVGAKSAGMLSTGYLNALEYAKVRLQGPDMTRSADPHAPKVAIIDHPDVRRSLMLQKSYAEGLRALYLYTAAHQDPLVARHVSGIEADLATRVSELLLPIVKGAGSERAYQYLTDSLQTLGGSGFLQDYPIEQYIRDTKIDSLYEGTTAIQAQDFFFRKIVRDKGIALTHLADRIREFAESGAGGGRLDGELDSLAAALADVQAMTAALTGHLMDAQREPGQLYKIGLGAVPFLLAVGDLLIGWQLLRQAAIAVAALGGDAAGESRTFYLGKIASARFFVRNVLPGVAATRVVLADLDDTIMDLDSAAF